MRKAKALARMYVKLTAEERFRLIVAASARGDKVERDRLWNAGERLVLDTKDHVPYISDHVDDLFGDDEEEGGDEGEEAGETGEKEQPELKADADSVKEGAGERPILQRYVDVALAAGFVLRTKAEGWKLFCQRMTVPAFALWEGLPGFDRLQRALSLSEKVAFEAGGFLRWLNVIRPAGEPERLKVPLRAEGLADATEELFRQRVEWWGG